ncbi:hypothetical protein BDV30DRAFT_115797 [Aspergillus minisclerotigenes]|uniref:Uncharacterized protein n=1 Tax=Aspergillus minisclerotigenes TaxID=656917 RepID=A0A5N6J4Q8_9EURO|nr:hypothetical protein BDV30DRAFT_115797 [Aspergillus minisclerotigenes]
MLMSQLFVEFSPFFCSQSCHGEITSHSITWSLSYRRLICNGVLPLIPSFPSPLPDTNTDGTRQCASLLDLSVSPQNKLTQNGLEICS